MCAFMFRVRTTPFTIDSPCQRCLHWPYEQEANPLWLFVRTKMLGVEQFCDTVAKQNV